MSTRSIFVGLLPDRRTQLFAAEDDGLWTTWKEGTDPNSGWTAWARFEPSITGVALGAVAPLSNLELQVFVTAFTESPTNVLGGPDVLTSRKQSADSNAGWTEWETFYPAKHGPPGSPATGIVALAVAPLNDRRLEVFMSEAGVGGSGPTPSNLLTVWQRTPDSWERAAPFNPPVGFLFSLTAAPLSDGRIQVWGVSGTEIWTTYKSSIDPDSAFVPWARFQGLPVPVTPAALAVGPLPDARLQLWAEGGGQITPDDRKILYTCWKDATDPNAGWSPWQEFISIKRTAIGGESESTITSLAVGPLSDGRLQLWALDSSGMLFSTWKLTRDANSDWAPWSRFATP